MLLVVLIAIPLLLIWVLTLVDLLRRHDLNAVLEVDQAPGMRCHRHAQANDGDAVFRHYCNARITPRSSAKPLSRPMPV